MTKSLRIIIISIIILVLLAIGITICIKTIGTEEKENNNISNSQIMTENQIEEIRNESLSNKNEASRIKSYIGSFFTSIETKDFQKAYNMLFENFKNNYFKTEREFEEYAKSKYPKNIVINYTSLDREGNYYIATLELIDGLNSSSKISQRIVIEETGLNQFKISFQVQ